MGSSANTIAGRLTKARAPATRCCCPPESSFGRWPSRSRRPTASTTWSNQGRSTSRPAMSSGSVMFSAAVSVGTRLNAWKTKPTRSRRSSVSRLSPSVMSVSPMNTVPVVGASRPAMQCRSVDFPDPDGPMIASTPAARSRVTPRAPRPRRRRRRNLAQRFRSRGRLRGRGRGHASDPPSFVGVPGAGRPGTVGAAGIEPSTSRV